MLQIGPHTLPSKALLAPMAGITDQAFRDICYRMGAGLCVSEMLNSKSQLWQSKKSQERIPSLSGQGVRAVQIVGTEPQAMAQAAQHYVELGAQIIDINMGCPAKKVCKKAAGSALLRDTQLVAEICQQTVNAVDVPVTLKIRTGWCPDSRNAVEIAKIAQDSGIQSLVIHGRTRACRFLGHAEYDTIASVKQSVSIPVIANGDITSVKKVRDVLQYTQADGVMIGRGAQGNPWLFRSINAALSNQSVVTPTFQEVIAVMSEQLVACEHHYGDFLGPKIARKHAAAYFQHWFSEAAAIHLRKAFNALEHTQQQLQFLNQMNNEHFSNTPSLPAQQAA